MDHKHRQKYKLLMMMVLTFFFFFAELIYGHLTGSLALIGDSYHMLSDVLALFIGFMCMKISARSSTQNTFGWARAEILGALINTVFLAALCFTIFIEAVEKFVDQSTIKEPGTLLAVGLLGLLVNLVGLCLFCGETGDHGHALHHVEAIFSEPGASREPHRAFSISRKARSDGELYAVKQELKRFGMVNQNEHQKEQQKEKEQESKRNSERESNASHNARAKPDREADSSAVGVSEAPPGGSRALGDSSLQLDQGDFAVDEKEEEEEEDDERVLEFAAADRNAQSADELERCSTSDVKDSTSALSLQNLNFSHTGEQMNIKGVFLHLTGDALGSVGVIISALLTIYNPDEPWLPYVDPTLSIIMVAIIMSTTVPLFRRSALILMQHVPGYIKVEHLAERLEELNGVLGIHELHIWQLVGNRLIASVHLICRSSTDYIRIAKEMIAIFHSEGIHSLTIQPEFVEDPKNVSRDVCLLSCMASRACVDDKCCSWTSLNKK